MKKAILFIPILMLMGACEAQVKSLDKAPLDLEKFDFSTKMSTLLPESTKNKENSDWYRVKNMSMSRDTVFSDEYGSDPKPKWLEYRNRSSSSGDTIASFLDLQFNSANFATTIDDKIMVANGIVSEISESEYKKLVTVLNTKYGVAVKTQGEFFKPFDIYTWTLKDRIIKFVPLFDDERSTMKIVVDKDNKTISNAEKTPHYRALLYVIDKKYADQVIGKFNTGDLLYCD
jgi:hypothetical protein